MASLGSCETDLLVVGLQPGEEYVTPVRIAATLIAVTITSAWFSSRKIKRLSLFFAHWLSGIVVNLGLAIDSMMVSVCWANSNAEGFIKAVKFVELSASNMLAITNLGICVNLALIVMSHRTQTRVKSVSSLRLILMFLLISTGIAAASIPFWDVTVVLGTGFWFTSNDKERRHILLLLMVYVEVVVGACMLIIVAWLLLFRMKKIMECWKLHRLFRSYFGLTIIGTAVNLGLGICGTINANLERPDTLLLSWSWTFRFIHIALDTIVLHRVLRARCMGDPVDHERSGSDGSDGLSSENHCLDAACVEGLEGRTTRASPS